MHESRRSGRVLCCISPDPVEGDAVADEEHREFGKMEGAGSNGREKEAVRSGKANSATNAAGAMMSNGGGGSAANSARSMTGGGGAPLPPLATKILNKNREGGGGGDVVGMNMDAMVDSTRSPSGKVFTVTPEGGIQGGMRMAANFSGELFQVVDKSGNATPQGATNNVAGILYKWVNFGKGWRPRWVTLTDGVLSYYKVHGPEKVTINDGRFQGFRTIGEETKRLMKKQRHHGHHIHHGDEKTLNKPSGTVQLKVHIQLTHTHTHTHEREREREGTNGYGYFLAHVMGGI